MNAADRAAWMIESDAFASGRVRHGFFGRRGGESSGIYAGNNCGFGSADDAARVAANRNRCVAALGLERLVTVYQRHTPTVAEVETPWDHASAPVADALVTRLAGVGLGILTADCAPVLLAGARALRRGPLGAGGNGRAGGAGPGGPRAAGVPGSVREIGRAHV